MPRFYNQERQDYADSEDLSVIESLRLLLRKLGDIKEKEESGRNFDFFYMPEGIIAQLLMAIGFSSEEVLAIWGDASEMSHNIECWSDLFEYDPSLWWAYASKNPGICNVIEILSKIGFKLQELIDLETIGDPEIRQNMKDFQGSTLVNQTLGSKHRYLYRHPSLDTCIAYVESWFKLLCPAKPEEVPVSELPQVVGEHAPAILAVTKSLRENTSNSILRNVPEGKYVFFVRGVLFGYWDEIAQAEEALQKYLGYLKTE